MATTKTDAQTQTEQIQASGTTDPNAGEIVTGKDADQAVADFLTNKRAPAGVSISRGLTGEFVVRKV